MESEEDVLARPALCIAPSSAPGPPASAGKSDSDERLRLGERCEWWWWWVQLMLVHANSCAVRR